MKRKKKLIFLVVILAVWLFLMLHLSSANGKTTLQESMALSEFLGKWIYHTPSETQLHALNLHLRKLAHVFLYLIFGGLNAILWNLLLEKHALWKRTVPAIVLSIFVAFADELHKIPIAGRHFSFSESVLNAVSACITILLLFLFYHRREKSLQTHNDKTN
ncbi:VanZ family protein [Ruminococcus sp.]